MYTKDEHSLELVLKKLENSPMLPYNKSRILDYYNEKIANGVKKISYIPVIRILTRLAEYIGSKRFEDLSKTEIVSFVNGLQPCEHILHTKHGKILQFKTRPYSVKTLWQYKAAIKTFYRWLFEIGSTDTPPEAVRWIRREGHKDSNPSESFKKDILSVKEAIDMINCARNPRDKAMVAILWETGLRASELLHVKKSHLNWHDNYVEFEASGKTGKRDVILVQSKPHLEIWLHELELRKNRLPEEIKDELWVSFNAKGFGTKYLGNKTMSRDNLNNMLKIVAKRAGITKRIWTHGMRHSAATKDSSNGWNEARMRIKFGWSKNSPMPSVYTHLANSDIKEAILEENGIIEYKDKKEKSLLNDAVKCMFCFTVNLQESDYCSKCGKPLKAEQFKVMEKKAEVTDVLQEMIKQELEKKGYDLGEIVKALSTKNEGSA